MKRLSRAMRQSGAGGTPLPPVFPQLEAAKARVRRSEVTMIAGEPGAGKSIIALWMAVEWVRRHDLRGIYFSADSAEMGQAARALAMSSSYGLSVEQAESQLKDRDETALKDLESIKNLMWSFENDVQYQSIDEELKAFVELWGTTPDFIVIDNLTDVDGQSDDEYGHMRRVMKGLTQLARATSSAVIVLHHTSEGYKAEPCPPKRSIHGKVSQKPAMILTTDWGDNPGKKPVAVVKNRFGDDDKSGHTAVWLGFEPATMRFLERV